MSSSGTTLYSNTGINIVTINVGVSDVTLDQNVEQINLSGALSSFAFKQTGNIINVHDSAGAVLLVKAPVQGDSDGTVLGFSDGTASVLLAGGVMTVGDAVVSAAEPTTLSPKVKPVP